MAALPRGFFRHAARSQYAPRVLSPAAHAVAQLTGASHVVTTAATVSHASQLTFFQAAALGLIQGVSELFPISSLGHTVVLPALFGWHNLVSAQGQSESFFLAFVVALHVGTALALLAFFWRDWIDIVRSVLRTFGTRKIETPNERLGWLLIVATIPAGITGLLLEHPLRTLFSKPFAASLFLIANGLILMVGEIARRRAADREAKGHLPSRRLDTLDFKEAGVIGVAQVSALLAGISRSGITMVAGLVRGLNHEDAARFAFLLATPIILAAGVYKIPDLLGPLGNGIRGQALVGAAAAAVAAFVSVKFLTRYFKTRTLWPFGVYCLLGGTALAIYFG